VHFSNKKCAFLYEMIAFIAEALSYNTSHSLQDRLNKQLEKLQVLTDIDNLLSLDIISCRLPVDELLLETSEYIRTELSSKVFTIKKGKQCRGVNWMGKNLNGKDLRPTFKRCLFNCCRFVNSDLRGVDFIGADLRDANLSGANLSTSIFLTQMQINSAKGNDKTILPVHIQPPSHWNN
jgi:uncharacterized protein YjbI with pentapeptide repeats